MKLKASLRVIDGTQIVDLVSEEGRPMGILFWIGDEIRYDGPMAGTEERFKIQFAEKDKAEAWKFFWGTS